MKLNLKFVFFNKRMNRVTCASCNETIAENVSRMEALTRFGIEDDNFIADNQHCKSCNVRRARYLDHLYRPDVTLVIVRRVVYRDDQCSTYTGSFIGKVHKVEKNTITVLLKSKRNYEPVPKVVAEKFPDCLPMIRLANGAHAVRFQLPEDGVYHPLVAVGTRCNKHCAEHCTIHVFEETKKMKL